MAIKFDGSDDYISCGTGALGVTDQISVAAWVYCTADSTDRVGGKHASGNFGWMFSRNASNDNCEWRISTNGSNWNGGNGSTNQFPINTWLHIVCAYDGANMRLYISGAEDTAATFPLALTGNINDSTQEIRIGHEAVSAVGTKMFNGFITEFSIWKVALSAAQIAQLASARVKGLPLQIQPSNLLNYWPMDDFAHGATASGADTIKDRTGTKHGTPTNSPLGEAEVHLSYPQPNLYVHAEDAASPAGAGIMTANKGFWGP